ncbi:MAG: DNA mismatch repair protein MutS [Bacteroidota bacterium]
MKIKKKHHALLQTYHRLKTEHFSFDRISSYFRNTDHSNYRQVISDATCQDLDFDELFMLMDRTCSKVGQQYLYHTLRTIPEEDNRVNQMERLISFFQSEKKSKDLSIISLHALSKPSAYFLQSLIYSKHIEKPKWFWAIRLSSVLTILSIILTFIKPIFFLLLLVLFTTNFIVHVWNKNNIHRYSNAIPQILLLEKVTSQLQKLAIPGSDDQSISDALKTIKEIKSKARYFKLEARMESDAAQVGEMFLELIKTLFLVEPIFLFNILDKLDSKRKEIETLFQFVGAVDVAISVDAYRNSLNYYSKPEFITAEKSFECRAIVHPLLKDAVANSLQIKDGKSILISGSNMSGKTTFIRTIGINCLLAQTINTTLSRTMKMPKLNVYSAIRIADDLMDEKSYYLEEVLTIKKMIENSSKDEAALFLLDELFKGTNTTERVAAGKAVLSHLNQRSNLVFAATHDLELTEHLRDSFRFYHFTEVIEDDQLSFDYQLKDGKLVHTNAIRILEINGYPKEVIEEARNLVERKITTDSTFK